jgi:hypothetical protein
MKNIDRFILLVIATGIWAVVLKPAELEAHSDDNHVCSGDGTGFGEPDGREVYVYSLNLNIRCFHG